VQLKGKKDQDGAVETTAILVRRYSFHGPAIEAPKETHLLNVNGQSCTYMQLLRDSEGHVTDTFQCRNGVAVLKTDKHGWLCHQHKPRVRNREVPHDAWATYSVDAAFIIAQDAKGRS